MATSPDQELDRLIELIVEWVRDRIGRDRLPAHAAAESGPRPGDERPGDERAWDERAGDKIDDEIEDEDGGSGGAWVIRQPWSVRSVEEASAARVGVAPGMGRAEVDLARLIDHTLLRPDATQGDVVVLCGEAREHRFASVCINPTWVPLCSSLLAGTEVKVCTVVGFPFGAMAPTAKAYEARDAVRRGAQEVDMVINLGALKSHDYETVFEDICRVVTAAAPALVKVILETGQLTEHEKVIACALSRAAGAHFVKTSTGFGKGGATVEDVALMRRIVGSEMGVKASGGVRTREDAIRMLQAGATRIGASASVAIVTGRRSDSEGTAAPQSRSSGS